MGFTDLKTDSGIAALNDFLSEKSYIEGVCASQADVAVFEAVGSAPNAAKSSVLIDVKPWDNETDLAEMERQVRQIKMEGLLWGGSQLVPIGYGIQKLQINCVVEDDKVGTDQLEEAICGLEDLVQSIDIAAFNKI